MLDLRQHAHQFDVSLSIQHEILRLQVSVEDALAMEVIESFCDASDAEFGSGLVKAPPKDKSETGNFLLISGVRSYAAQERRVRHLNPLGGSH